MPSLKDLLNTESLKSGGSYLSELADTIANLPTNLQRVITHPQIFNKIIGYNPMQRETGFAAAATGLPPKQEYAGGILNPPNLEYEKGYESGEPVAIAAGAAPFAIPIGRSAGKALAPKMYEMAEDYMVKTGGLIPITAWHGTPHNIQGKFDINKVGTGEGAQAYGHGMYFAEAPSVAETYKRAGGGLEVKFAKPLEELGIKPDVAARSMDFEDPLNQGLGRIAKGLRTTALDYPDVPINQSLVKEHFDEYIRLLDEKYPKEAAQKKALQDLVAKEGYPDINFGGNLYKVDIPDADIPNMLDWDKPLSKMTERESAIIEPLKQKLIASKNPYNPESFETIGQIIQSSRGSNPNLEKELAKAGFTGIRYLDEGSREAGKGTSNFVVFDPSNVKILEQNNKPVTRKELIQEQINKIE